MLTALGTIFRNRPPDHSVHVIFFLFVKYYDGCHLQ